MNVGGVSAMQFLCICLSAMNLSSAVVTRHMAGAVREAVEVLELPANRQILEQLRAECIFFLHNSILCSLSSSCIDYDVFRCLWIVVCTVCFAAQRSRQGRSWKILHVRDSSCNRNHSVGRRKIRISKYTTRQYSKLADAFNRT